MAVSNQNNKLVYTGDGVTIVFPYTFKIFQDTDLVAEIITKATGVITTLALGVDFTVSGVGNETGGDVTLIGSFATTPPDNTVDVVVRRLVPLTQGIDYVENDPFPAEVAEEGYDRLTFITQQLNDETDRAVKLSVNLDPNVVDPSLPTPSAGDGIGWNATGTGLVNDPANFAQTVADAQAAEAAAQAAAAAAATSEANASASEAAAGTSETNAATSETNAANSASNAATSASNAATSEVNAANSASSASTSASAAATSAANAATSEANAAASETNASTSETNASTSETNAGTSETNAAASAAAAAASAAGVNLPAIQAGDAGKILEVVPAETGYQLVTNTGGSTTGVSRSINQVGHGFSVGDILRHNGTQFVLAQADTATNAEVVGIVGTVSDIDNFILNFGGYLTGLSGLTAGEAHFLSPTVAGALTSSNINVEGQISKPLLIADSATSGYLLNMRGVEITDSTSFFQAFDNSNLVAGVATFSHNLGHKFAIVQVYDNNDLQIIPDEVTLIDDNSLSIDLSSFTPITGLWRVVILDIGATTNSIATDLNIPSQAQGDALYFNGTMWSRLPATNAGDVFTSQGAGVNPTFSPVPLPADLNIASQVQGDILYFNGTNWVRLPAGVSGESLLTQGIGANPIYGLPSDFNIAGQQQGSILYFNGANWVHLAPGAAGNLLQTNGVGANPIWTPPPASGLTASFFSSGGTFNVPVGITRVFVTMIGGGGGGGGGGATGGGGGGSAEYLINHPFTVTPSAALPITIGSGGNGGANGGGNGGVGGTTSFDTLSVVGGGGGMGNGDKGIGGGNGFIGQDGISGGGPAGSLGFQGADGGMQVTSFGGGGASSPFGRGGMGGSGGDDDGDPAIGFGAGGGGSANGGGAGGGVGSAGMVLLIY